MRLLSGFLFFLLLVGCSNQNHVEKLNGTWELVAQEIGGMKLPVTASLNQTLVINGEEYSMTAESVDKGTITANETQLDIFGTDGPNAGKTFKAIYKLENDKLTISLKNNKGVDRLIDKIMVRVKEISSVYTGPVITSEREFGHVKRALKSLERINYMDPALDSEDINHALIEIGLITEKTHNEEILGRIFNDFCIGK